MSQTEIREQSEGTENTKAIYPARPLAVNWTCP